MGVKIKGSLQPATELLEAIQKAYSGATVEAGYIKPEADRIYEVSTGKPTVAQVAFWNEYGTKSKDGSQAIPARPFMRRSVANAQDDLPDEIDPRALTSGNVAAMEGTLVDLAEAQARAIHRELQTTRQWAKPNSETWIRHKGHNQQLHYTLQMSYSIRGRAVRKNGSEIGRVKV